MYQHSYIRLHEEIVLILLLCCDWRRDIFLASPGRFAASQRSNEGSRWEQSNTMVSHPASIGRDSSGRTQPARNFLMRHNDDHGFRFLIRDGAGQFTRSFDEVFAGSGITAIRTPPRAPQANAFAERWVRTLRHELLDRTIIWNEKQLRSLVVEYIEHYNSHRPHRGIDQRAPNDTADVAILIGQGLPIRRHSTCGGLINEYRTAA